jgi:osmotically-inducible protein OsmY
MSPELDQSAYIAEHVREELLRDPRVGELDVHLEIEGEVVFVRGNVSTPDRCAALDEVLAELLPGFKIRNEATVAVFPEAPE